MFCDYTFRTLNIESYSAFNDSLFYKSRISLLIACSLTATAQLNLWYSGCGPCRAEMPELSTWKEQFVDVMFFSATYHDAELVKKITSKQHFTWTHFVKAVNDNALVYQIIRLSVPILF